MTSLYWQFVVAPSPCQNFQASLDVRSNHWDVARKLANCNEEVTEEDKEAVEFDQEPGEWPAEEDQDDSDGEGGGALEFLGPSEEDHGLLDTDDEGQADQEEDLGYV